MQHLRPAPRLTIRAIGEHDIDSPPARAKEGAAVIPGATFVEIAGANHLAPFTHPDAVAATLLEFFART